MPRKGDDMSTITKVIIMALVVLLAAVNAAAADRTESHDYQNISEDNRGTYLNTTYGDDVDPESGLNETDDEDEADDQDEDDALETLTSPDGPLYDLRIVFEDMDEAFTFNATDRLNKKLAHAEERLNEANRMAKQGKAYAVGRVMSKYENEVEDIEGTDSTDVTEKGLENAYIRIQKHEAVLRGVLANVTSEEAAAGLQNALSNSERLEKKFMEKLDEKKREKTREERETPGRRNPAEKPTDKESD